MWYGGSETSLPVVLTSVEEVRAKFDGILTRLDLILLFQITQPAAITKIMQQKNARTTENAITPSSAKKHLSKHSL